jgi:hypothetical protein
VKIGRNEPCPCGSGAKVKRCCGVESIRRSHEALTDLFQLASHFPRQRPATEAFDAWASRTTAEITLELLEEGVAQLAPAERARIPTEFAAAYPELWEAVLADARFVERALHIALLGAVVAGLEERRREIDPLVLVLLELDEDARRDPVESLAFVVTPEDLWNAVEVAEAEHSLDRGLTVESIAGVFWSEWHEQRLRELVRRVRRRLPLEAFPAASSAIEDACGTFERDPRVRARLGAELLLDALPPPVAEAPRLAA